MRERLPKCLKCKRKHLNRAYALLDTRESTLDGLLGSAFCLLFHPGLICWFWRLVEKQRMMRYCFASHDSVHLGRLTEKPVSMFPFEVLWAIGAGMKQSL